MNVLSLFDGISCGQIALQRANISYNDYFSSEIDKYAIAVTQSNFPNTTQIGDVTDISKRKLPNIDLLIGGSPCQGFSLAGNHLNFADPRSKLFFEYVKILNKIKPKYFLFENVKMKQEYIDIISGFLGVTPICINSSMVSAQNRIRYYWTNIPHVTQPEKKHIILAGILESGMVDRNKSYCIDANYFKGGNLKSYFKKHRRQLVFLSPSLDGCLRYRKLTPLECERLQTLPDNYTLIDFKGNQISNTQRYKMIGNGWTVEVIAHIFKKLIRLGE